MGISEFLATVIFCTFLPLPLLLYERESLTITAAESGDFLDPLITDTS